MKRNRTAIVLMVAVITAGLASYGVYQAIQKMPVRQVEVASVKVVVASQVVPVGTRLTTDHMRVVSWPASNPVPGAFEDPKQLVDRGVISTLNENEPITTLKVAGPEAGAGLPPVIPPGMRAISVRVNDVIGVAGFVLPGTRVDLLVTVREDGPENGRGDPMSRTVVSNVLVLTAGTRLDQEKAKDGQPQQSSVVTLAVLPQDAERVALASTEGSISLVLRNPVDAAPTSTPGIKLTSLMRGTGPEPVIEPKTRRMVPSRTLPPVTPVAPSIYTVETIRAAKRGEEVVR
jgi:pilus assembly protein CpaB